MKIWLDDLCNDKDTDRFTPEGFIGCQTALQACRLIKTGQVTYISFDHDLGNDQGFDGYLVARYIEKLAYFDKIPKLRYDIHSSNPVGRDNIVRAMASAERYWR